MSDTDLLRNELIDRLDTALDRDLSEAMARALNAEAHTPDPADAWRTLATALRDAAGWADHLANA